MVHRWLPVVGTTLVILAATSVRPSGSVSGTHSPTIVYDGVVRDANGTDLYRFTVDLDEMLFRLLAAGGKYRVARLKIQNATTVPLALSAADDRLELVLRNDATVAAVLNLQDGDPSFWDALSADTRETLAYPVSLNGVPAPATGRPPSPESQWVYVFFPAATVSDLPKGFAYRIASLGQTIRIERHAAAAR